MYYACPYSIRNNTDAVVAFYISAWASALLVQVRWAMRDASNSGTGNR